MAGFQPWRKQTLVSISSEYHDAHEQEDISAEAEVLKS
jgi:hypothetical protein